MYDADSIAKDFFDKVVKRHEFNKATDYYTGPQQIKFELCVVNPCGVKYNAIKAVAGEDCELHKKIYTNYTNWFIEEIFKAIRKHISEKGYSIEDQRKKSFLINLA